MNIRKITYTVGHIHILTFSKYFKSILAPYFSYEPLEYGIDNDGSIHENARLVFRESGFILQFNKEVATLIYEGDVAEVKKHNPIIDIFFDIYEKVTKIDGFIKTKNNKIIIDFIEIYDPVKYAQLLEQNKYFPNVFGNLNEFALIHEFKKADKDCRFQLGNFTEKDIHKSNLSSLNTKFNRDLFGNVGLMIQISVNEKTSSPSFSKFKSLIKDAEQILAQFRNKIDGENI